MFSRKTLATVAGSAAIAVVIGHVMQFGLPFAGSGEAAAPARAVVPLTAETLAEFEASMVTPEESLDEVLPFDPVVALALAETTPRIRPAIPADSVTAPDNSPYLHLNAFGASCAVALDLKPARAAKVDVRISAPCHANERVEIALGALKLTLRTSPQGLARALVPAFASENDVVARFDDGTEAKKAVTVPEADRYDRVALNWRGDLGLSIHAFEFGAGPGDPGHVHIARQRAVARLTGLPDGEIVTLGDASGPDPIMAQIYSFPTGDAERSGVVKLMVEAGVTTDNCGTTVAADVLQTGPGEAVQTTSVSLAMPGCDAVGEIIVLHDVFQDMQVAAVEPDAGG